MTSERIAATFLFGACCAVAGAAAAFALALAINGDRFMAAVNGAIAGFNMASAILNYRTIKRAAEREAA